MSVQAAGAPINRSSSLGSSANNHATAKRCWEDAYPVQAKLDHLLCKRLGPCTLVADRSLVCGDRPSHSGAGGDFATENRQGRRSLDFNRAPTGFGCDAVDFLAYPGRFIHSAPWRPIPQQPQRSCHEFGDRSGAQCRVRTHQRTQQVAACPRPGFPWADAYPPRIPSCASIGLPFPCWLVSVSPSLWSG